MARNGDPPELDEHGYPPRPEPWHESHGREEFKLWQKAHPLNHISYENWKVSTYVDGLSLYYAAVRICTDFPDSDSDDADERQRVETRSRVQSTREPKKSLATNGNGSPRVGASTSPPATADLGDLGGSGKKKRKPRKKPKSKEVVASEGDSDAVEVAATPTAPIVTANGQRKSSTRKPRKKPISDETISPEDEEDDPMAIDATATTAIASPLPVRTATNSTSTAQNAEPRKRTILKLITRKPSMKRILDDDTDGGAATTAGATAPNITAETVATNSEPDNAIALENLTSANFDPDGDEYDASPAREGESAAAAATRRGLRTRRPAQKRPYSYDAELYEEHETDVPENPILVLSSPDGRSRRASITSLNKGYGEPVSNLDRETLAILQGDVEPDEDAADRRDGRPKHFKGKGRAWKKEESDEDLEFNPGKKKGSKAKAKVKAQIPKKRGRPRKNAIPLSEDTVRDDSDSDAPTRAGASSSPGTPTPAAQELTRKARRTSRKSALSEEIVRDDSDEEVQKNGGDVTMLDAPAPVVTPTPKKRGRPRKSDQSVVSKTSSVSEQVVGTFTPKGTPPKAATPKPATSKAATPKVVTPEEEPPKAASPQPEPPQRVLTPKNEAVDAMDIDKVEETKETPALQTPQKTAEQPSEPLTWTPKGSPPKALTFNLGPVQSSDP